MDVGLRQLTLTLKYKWDITYFDKQIIISLKDKAQACDQASGMGGSLLTTYPTVRYQCVQNRYIRRIVYSFLPTIRERNCFVLKDDRIWAKRETTSPMVGRLAGSSLTMSATSGSINSKPYFFCGELGHDTLGQLICMNDHDGGEPL